MSLHSHNPACAEAHPTETRATRWSRRKCLHWAVASLTAPMVARAGTDCPCANDGKDDHSDSPSKPPQTPVKELRVCADPNNLPFSNREHEGFEDKIAAL